MTYKSNNRNVVAIDFDYTLCSNSKFGLPAPHVEAFAKQLYDRHTFVIIFTARPLEDKRKIEAWLMRHNIKFDLILTDKLRFDLLVDDRAVRPEELLLQEHLQPSILCDYVAPK